MGEFVKVARVDEILPGQAKVVEVGDKQIAVFNVAGSIHAIDDTCTHVGGPLSEGDLEGTRVTCPWHGAVFDVTTGDVLGPPAVQGVTKYNTRVEDGVVEVEVC